MSGAATFSIFATATPPEQLLWRAVILRAFLDAVAKPHRGDTPGKKNAWEARHWLTANTGEFRTVCWWAGYDPDLVRGAAERCQAKGWCNSLVVKFSARYFRPSKKTVA